MLWVWWSYWKKCQSSLIFYCKIPILCQSLAKSVQILLVVSDRTDTFRVLWNYLWNAFPWPPFAFHIFFRNERSMGSNPMKIRSNGKSRWQWLVEGSVRTGAGNCPEFGTRDPSDFFVWYWGQVTAESMFLMAAAIAYRYSHLSKGNDAQHWMKACLKWVIGTVHINLVEIRIPKKFSVCSSS